MISAHLTAAPWLVLARHELFLFAATFFTIGACDEFAIDIAYLWLKVTGRARTRRVDESQLANRKLQATTAVLIPAWQEAGVIAATIRHARAAWPQSELRLYVGCYPNDPATLAAVEDGAGGDARVRAVVHKVDGPTCKADCLNRLYRALTRDEVLTGDSVRMVVLHDAEDMVDPAALALLDATMDHADFVQLPVLALPRRSSPLVASHYSDEFAEAHGKAMVVRDALGQGIPGAGVGCAIRRHWLALLDAKREGEGPFATGALTEDYELGLQCAALGARSRFLRVRTLDGRLIATRAFFPSSMGAAIRQKTRWIHGIAFQSWDRLGWQKSPAALWMQIRDRRGPFAALLLVLAYLLVVASGAELGLVHLGWLASPPLDPTIRLLLWCNLMALAWRLGLRAAFTTREFGLGQGLLAIPRVIVSNTVAIVAARRALFAYVRSLRGARIEWDKTEHDAHPALGEAPPDAATVS